jgi:hypothetical protein
MTKIELLLIEARNVERRARRDRHAINVLSAELRSLRPCLITTMTDRGNNVIPFKKPRQSFD